MRTIITETKAYKFSELSDSAKESAIESCHQINVHADWFDCVFEDAKTIAELGGIEIRDIYFSGFCSQGDGACFTGSYSYVKGALKRVKEYAPKDSELHEIFAALQDVQRRNFYQLSAGLSHRGHYNHSGCMAVDCHNYGVSQDDYETLRDTLRLFADWIYSKLNSEHDYLTSEKSVAETIEANELEFTENGKLI